MRVVLVWICAGAVVAAAQNAPPPLPPGLKPEKPAETQAPALPPGLEAPVDQPALPPGLEADPAEPEAEAPPTAKARPFDIHGFWEVRGGLRTQNDPVQPRDAIMGETRLQLKYDRTWNRTQFDIAADLIGDGVTEDVGLDLRQLRLTWTPVDNVDIRVGRQVLTWGTGDLLFINDLFPKDFVSFFIGRDEEYLKAPSDSLKVSWFTDIVNIDVVYTPEFESDVFPTGERISFYNPIFGGNTGRAMQTNFDSPSDWFHDDEIALRLYRTIGSYEVALYGYWGYWKSPGGQDLTRFQATFPRLNAYGASVRGAIANGIGNIEIGYYDSRDDATGRRPLIENSQFRILFGYERELGAEFTGAFQYYVEHMMDYSDYRDTLPGLFEPRDEDRHVVTARFTKLLRNQDLELSAFLFWSPSDGDAYLRPRMNYKLTDDWQLTVGGNVFIGSQDHTFFGQLEDNSNVYAGIRYSF